MRRFRRRAKLFWMPNVGTELDGNTTFDDSPSGRFFSIINLNAGNPSSTIETELTFDQPAERGVTELGLVNPLLIDAMTMADWQGTAWRLRRCVGKMFAGASLEDQQVTGPPAVLFTAGLIVRTIEVDSGLSPLPVGDRDPKNLSNIRDPWIWRRQWVLSTTTPGLAAGVTDVLEQFPRTTANYGSVQDGPHVDAKTNRVIGPQERLFLTLNGTILPLPTVTTVGRCEIHGYFDYRLLGTTFKASNRRNASR